METITVNPVHRAISWLSIQYGQKEVRFVYPPVQGTHQECFQALAKDKELRPAKGLDHALLTYGAYGAYKGKEQEWEDVRQKYFVDDFIRMPSRMKLIPAGHIIGDPTLSGVLFEEDLAGNGLSTTMQIPNLSGWIYHEGIYRAQDGTSLFIPSVMYEGKPFEQDSLAHALLTPEGAALFARTVHEAGKTPYNWIAKRMKDIEEPEQLVPILNESRKGKLNIAGLLEEDENCYAFGCL